MAITDLAQLKPGQVIQRQGPGKTLQGSFVSLTESRDGAIVREVVNLTEPSFVAEAGILKAGAEESLFAQPDSFADSSHADAALAIVKDWTLFKEEPGRQADILAFVRAAYSPGQLVALKKTGTLATLFIPLQQRFKIGKFREKVDWDAVGVSRFKALLDGLEDEAHITYIAFIPKDSSGAPRFYSIGTKPHLETITNLKREPFGFRANLGGHIKIVSPIGATPRRFVVDAGSNDLGSGMHTALATAEMVTDALTKVYPGAEYTPLAGRGAHGLQQSY